MMKISEYVSVYNREEKEASLLMSTTAPFVMAVALSFNSKRVDDIAHLLEDLANGRRIGYRIPGYSIFLVYKGNLMKEKLDQDFILKELAKMGLYFQQVIIPEKPGKYAKAADDYYNE